MGQPNYTEEQTAQLVEAYKAAETQADRDMVVDEFAAEFGKTVRSIRQKLVRENVYVKKTYKTKKGEKPEQKSAIVADIASTLGIETTALGGLELSTKEPLKLIRANIRALASLAFPEPDDETEIAD